MSVTYDQLLTRVVEDGIAACEKDYANDSEKREGSVAGFEICRGKGPAELGRILTNARRRTREAMVGAAVDKWLRCYWRTRCFELEVEWVCNVISAALASEGKAAIVTPTARGMLKAAEIIGFAPRREPGK